MKIASWNVNSLKVRLPHVLDWLAQTEVDLLALQETKLTDDKFPLNDIEAAGYQVIYAGQKTYNGVAILSRHRAEDVLYYIPQLPDRDRRILAGTFDGVRVLNLYVVNGQQVGTDKYAYKLDWLTKVTAFVSEEMQHYDHLVVLGDFNIAPQDRDVHDPTAWREKVLCSTPERQSLQRLLSLGLSDTFRLFNQEDKSFSWWDYRAGGFRRNLGLRIDLILASPALADACCQAYIDTAPRKRERPSDHTPVVAAFDL